MELRSVMVCVAVFLFMTTGYGQSYPGYYIDREGIVNETTFLIEPGLFSRQPDFETIISGICTIENGRKSILTPAMCQSVHFHTEEGEIEFLSLPNIIDSRLYTSERIFLRPKIIGSASLYYYYYFSNSPAVDFNTQGKVHLRKPGPLSLTKQGWIIAKEDGSTIKVTRRLNKKDLAAFFSDNNSLSVTVLRGKTRPDSGETERLVVGYNNRKLELENLRAVR